MAGVAVSTASRALTVPGRVAEPTAARVRDAAERLGYSPSASGRALSSGRRGLVALLVTDVTNPVFFGIIRGVQSRLALAGSMHVLVDTQESGTTEEQALQTLRASVDGVILAASRLDGATLATWARVVPLVTVNRPGSVASVVIDTADGSAQALEHLAFLGHRRVAYAAGPRTSWSDQNRREVLDRTATRLGVDVVPLGPYVPRREAGPAAADAALLSGATAVLAFNDLLAFGILDRLAARGVDVPGRMSVVGVDDIFGADLVRPGLTTVASPLVEAGQVAADLLLARIRPRQRPRGAAGHTAGHAARPERAVDPVEWVTIPTHLVVRGSTGPAPTAG